MSNMEVYCVVLWKQKTLQPTKRNLNVIEKCVFDLKLLMLMIRKKIMNFIMNEYESNFTLTH